MTTQPKPVIEEQETLEVIRPHTLELLERAQIDMQIATAKKWPRTLSVVKKRMLDFATLDEDTAESCFYTLSREGKNIQGPSVRLAEIAVACYQNLRAGSRVIDNDGKAVTAQAICHDLENNTSVTIEVKRRITNKHGKTYSEDMQIVTGNAAVAIAFRNAVFKIIPGALVKPVYEAAKQVAVGDASTLSTKREKVIARLNAMQVSTQRILKKLGKASVEDIGLEDLETLIGLGTAIRDGDTTVDEAFETPSDVAAAGTQEKAEALRDKLAAAKQKPAQPNPILDSDAWRDAVIEFQDLASEMKWSDAHIEKGIADAKGKDGPLAYLQQGIQQLKAFKAEKAGAAQGDK